MISIYVSGFILLAVNYISSAFDKTAKNKKSFGYNDHVALSKQYTK